MRAAASARVRTTGRFGTAPIRSKPSQPAAFIPPAYEHAHRGRSPDFLKTCFSYEKDVLISILVSAVALADAEQPLSGRPQALKARRDAIRASNREVQAQQSRAVLQAALDFGVPGRRITRAALAKELERLLDIFDCRRSVQSYLRLNIPARPHGRVAWAIGEALHALGITWASGLWCLHAAGRLDAFVAVIAHCLSTRSEFTKERLEELRRLLETLPDVYHPYDMEFADFAVNVQRARLKWERVTDIRMLLQIAFDQSGTSPLPDDDTPWLPVLEAAYGLASTLDIPVSSRNAGVQLLLLAAIAEAIANA